MRRFAFVRLALSVLIVRAPMAHAVQPNVVSTSPVANAEAAATDAIIVNFDTPLAPASTIDVQLHQSSGGACWGTTFSMPFLKQDGQQLKAKSD